MHTFSVVTPPTDFPCICTLFRSSPRRLILRAYAHFFGRHPVDRFFVHMHTFSVVTPPTDSSCICTLFRSPPRGPILRAYAHFFGRGSLPLPARAWGSLN